MTDQETDELIQNMIFGAADLDLYSAAQVTDLLAAFFIFDAEAFAEDYLGAPDTDDGLRLAA